MAGAWVSIIGALVGSTVAVLIAWASVGTCLGSLAAVFLVLLDGGVLLRAQAQVSLLFGVLIAGGIAFSWFQVSTCIGGTFLVVMRMYVHEVCVWCCWLVVMEVKVQSIDGAAPSIDYVAFARLPPRS